jgi:hypothetical protein
MRVIATARVMTTPVKMVTFRARLAASSLVARAVAIREVASFSSCSPALLRVASW